MKSIAGITYLNTVIHLSKADRLVSAFCRAYQFVSWATCLYLQIRGSGMSLLREKTQRLIEDTAEEYPAVMGLYSVSLTEPEEEFSVNADEVFPTASVIKVPVLVEFYRQAEEGLLDPGEVRHLRDEDKVGGSGVLQHLAAGSTGLTLEDYAKLMINLSDNTATNVVIDLVGMDNVNRLLQGLGFDATRLVRKMQAKGLDPDRVENLSTPRELTGLMEAIYRGEGLSPGVCERTLAVLGLYKPGVIRDAVQGGVVVADKSGWMGGVECDTGIVYAAKPYAVTVMAKNIPSWDQGSLEAKEALRETVSAVHDYYLNIGTATKHGRRR
jgi:beta-lactamase class A